MNKKNNKIQIVRGISALFVILIHTMPKEWFAGQISIRPILNIAVAAFLFLSGYLTKTNLETKSFYKKRITRVLFPYLIFTILYAIPAILKKPLNQAAITIAKNLIAPQDNTHLYFLVVYMQLVLLTPLLAKIAARKSKLLNITIFAIQPLFILCLYLGVLNGIILKETPFCNLFFPAWIAYYYLGLLIGNNLIKPKLETPKLAILISIGWAMQIFEGLFWLKSTTVQDMYGSQIRITTLLQNIPLLLLITRYIRRQPKEGNKFLCKIGDASFGIYLLHPAFILLCNKFLIRSTTTFLITFAFAAIYSYLAVLIINKILPKKIIKYTGLEIS